MTATVSAPEPVLTPVRQSPRRRRLFIALSLLFPVFLLVAMEGGLRIAGYGGYPPTLRRVGTLEDGSSLVLADNGGPASYFFANRSRAGSLHQSAFVMPKPAGTVRVMFIGESAAKGFPQSRSLSSPSFLQAMLSDLWPDRTVEVINLGTTAIASYPALGMLTESLEFEPDLVVVYVGNNEFFGAYGVASLHSAGRSPAIIRTIRAFRSLGVAQFIDKHLGVSDATERKTLMEAMVGQSYIGPADPLRDGAARNLGVFVGDMIDRCRARNVPVVVCTPPANERDLAPLGGYDFSRSAYLAREKVDTLLKKGIAALAGDAPAAEAALTQVVEITPDYAMAHYLLGKAQRAQGRFADAAASFRKAVDLDPMPWRPPARSVQAIRDAAASHGAVLCDLESAFHGASPDGSTGAELMDDHVHPSLRGQDLVARSIVRALAKVADSLTVAPAAAESLLDWRAYAVRLGENRYDAYAAAHTIRVLGTIPFYRDTNPELFERFDIFCRGIESPEVDDVRKQLIAWQKPETHKGEQRPITGMVGYEFMRMGKLAEAEPLMAVAAKNVSLYSSWNLEFTYLMLACRERVKGALDEADRALALQAVKRGYFLVAQGRSATGQPERYVGRLLQLRGEHEQAIPFLLTARQKLAGSELVAGDQALVEAYLKTGNADKARAVIDNGIQNSGQYAELYQRMLPMLNKQ
jgi:tetratricopeptide (TPR) repeat protein